MSIGGFFKGLFEGAVGGFLKTGGNPLGALAGAGLGAIGASAQDAAKKEEFEKVMQGVILSEAMSIRTPKFSATNT
jgi:hypothetical protein